MFYPDWLILRILHKSFEIERRKGHWSEVVLHLYIPDKKRNAPLKTVQLSGRSRVIGRFSLYQCKGMLGSAA